MRPTGIFVQQIYDLRFEILIMLIPLHLSMKVSNLQLFFSNIFHIPQINLLNKFVEHPDDICIRDLQFDY